MLSPSIIVVFLYLSRLCYSTLNTTDDIGGSQEYVDEDMTSRTVISESGEYTFKRCTFSCTSSKDVNGSAIYCCGNSTDESNINISLTIIECRFSECNGSYGGGIYCKGNGSVSIMSCNFTSCISQNSGGAIYIHSDMTLNISDCLFINCSASSSGGAIYVYESSLLLITNSLFQNCTSGDDGGALHIDDGPSTLNVTASEFTNCTASAGSAISIEHGPTTLNITACAFTDCTGFEEGAIYLSNSQYLYPTLYSCTFTNCTAGMASAVSCQSEHLRIDSCSFTSCSASSAESGGSAAIGAVLATSPLITNSNFSSCSFKSYHDSATYAGALYCLGGIISNCLFDSCTADSDPSGKTFGGALANIMYFLKVDSCHFKHCSANGRGGAIAESIRHDIFYAQDYWIKDCVFEDNRASISGHDIFIMLTYGVSEPYESLLDGSYTKTDQSNRLVVMYVLPEGEEGEFDVSTILSETAHDDWLPLYHTLSTTAIVLISVTAFLTLLLVIIVVIFIILYCRRNRHKEMRLSIQQEREETASYGSLIPKG